MSVVIPPGETIVETRKCRLTGKEFVITDKDAAFYEKISPVFGGKKYLIPFPTLCPEEREKRRGAWRNYRSIYKRTCDATGKEIISNYHPDSKHIVFEQHFWDSDAFDAGKFARDIDFSEKFFDQLHALHITTPVPSRAAIGGENSEFCNNCVNLKDCYLLASATHSQDCMYGTQIIYSEDCVDCMNVRECRECYGCAELLRSQKCYYSSWLIDCWECHACTNCIGCTSCIECDGLINQKYCIRNRAVGKEAFEKALAEKSFSKEMPHPQEDCMRRQTNCEASTGTRLANCARCYRVDGANKCEDVRYSSIMTQVQDSSDVFGGSDLTQGYELVTMTKGRNSAFCAMTFDQVENLFYCIECRRSKDCFLCVGLKNAQYCILNKQYTKEEYEAFVPKIIEKMIQDWEWWEFFPSSMSPFGYNETVAQEYYPLTREDVLSDSSLGKGGGRPLGRRVWDLEVGTEEANVETPTRSRVPSPFQGDNSSTFVQRSFFNWSDYEPPFPLVEKVIPGEKLPDTIQQVPDDVLNWAIKCETSWKLFKIVKPELEFYRKHSLPLPRKHPDVRHGERLKRRSA